jgi:hypothetical protein
MVLFQNCVRQSCSPTKMAAAVQLRCYWKQLWSRWAITGSWEPLVSVTLVNWDYNSLILFILHILPVFFCHPCLLKLQQFNLIYSVGSPSFFCHPCLLRLQQFNLIDSTGSPSFFYRPCLLRLPQREKSTLLIQRMIKIYRVIHGGFIS